LDLILRAVDISLSQSSTKQKSPLNEQLIGEAIQNFFSLRRQAEQKKFINVLKEKNNLQERQDGQEH
jgi:hypothetical protein